MAVFKRGKLWCYRVNFKNADGAYVRKNGSGFRTKKEAQLAEGEVKQSLNKGFNLSAGDELFTDFFQEWFDLYRKGKRALKMIKTSSQPLLSLKSTSLE
ncbi:Arm DNA-binding domain-containing protein [Listeria booriae]|uniref:Arm DNA-binding domain-containing protein n=1 Tax=Listeria booriae TaxID=1552123 RepID=UPI0021AB1C2D|nr:Arm DNA-binding domain-containing protein [Listeria booriae]